MGSAGCAGRLGLRRVAEVNYLAVRRQSALRLPCSGLCAMSLSRLRVVIGRVDRLDDVSIRRLGRSSTLWVELESASKRSATSESDHGFGPKSLARRTSVAAPAEPVPIA